MRAEAAVDIADLCFTARALAQTHPMTEAAHRYRQRCFESERARQPITELADWASTALLVGYCLRRAEEQVVGVDHDGANTVELAPTEEEVAAVADALRFGDADAVTLLAGSVTVSALDRIIAAELDKRSEHLREQLDDSAWAELVDYIAWWVIHGYGVRTCGGPVS